MGMYQSIYKPFGQEYRTDWPGIVGTAAQLGVSAYQLATGAQPLAPGAGVMAPGPEAPELLQRPPEAAGTSPWLLIGGAALVYFVLLK